MISLVRLRCRETWTEKDQRQQRRADALGERVGKRERKRASVFFAPSGRMFVSPSCSILNLQPIQLNGEIKHMLRLHWCSIPSSEAAAVAVAGVGINYSRFP